MILTFSPIRMDATLAASVDGDVLTLNGIALDFGPLPSGATLPRAAIDNPWIAGAVERAADGTLTVPLLLPHGGSAPHETRFATPITVLAGVVALPAHDTVETAE